MQNDRCPTCGSEPRATYDLTDQGWRALGVEPPSRTIDLTEPAPPPLRNRLQELVDQFGEAAP